MSFVSKLRMESAGMLLAIVFYALVGVVFLVLLPFTSFPPHIGIIGIFSLIAAYGAFRKRGWTIWFAMILFCIATTFSVYTLYYYLMIDYLLGAGTLVYLILTWVCTVYLAAKRKSLES